MLYDHTQLLSLITQESAQAQQLHDILQKEYDAFGDNNLEQLAQLSELKTTALDNLGQCSAARLQWLTDHNLPHNASALEHSALNTQDDLIQSWETLAQHYEKNRSLSHMLSLIVQQAQKRTQQKLHLLRGSQPEDSHTYDNRGAAQTNTAVHGTVIA